MGGEVSSPAVRPRYIGSPNPGDLAGNGQAGKRSRTIAPSYSQIFQRHRLVFFLVVLVTTLVALIYSLSTTPSYQAKAVLEVEFPATTPQGFGPTSTSNEIGSPTFDSYLANQIGILQSDQLIRLTANKLHLADRLNSVQPQGLVAVRKHLRIGRSPSKYSDDGAFEFAKRNLVVRQARTNSLIEILFTAPSPALSSAFVNALATEYAAQNVQARWEMTEQLEGWLGQQLTALRTKLEQSESQLQQYSQQAQILPMSEGDSLAVDRLRQLQERTSEAEAARIDKQTRVEAAAGQVMEAAPALQQDPVFQQEREKLTDLQRQLAEADQIYTPNNVKTKTIQAQIAQLQTAIEQEQSVTAARLRTELGAAIQNEQRLKAKSAAQFQVVNQENEKMIRFNTLKHEVDTNRAIYESVLQKVKQSAVSAALQVTNVRIVDPGVPPALPNKPKHVVNVGAGLLSGTLLGLMCVVLLERRQSKLRSVLSHSSVLELGIVPEFPREAKGTRNMVLVNSAYIAADSSESAIVNDHVRGVMTSLLHAGFCQEKSKVLVLTSPVPGEGKTTITCALGKALAKTGRRVLIVDADLRRPRLHDLFQVAQTPGLLELAGTEGPLPNNGPLQYARPTTVPNLHVLPSGMVTSDHFDLLHSRRLPSAIAAMRKEYDAVLIDSPPILGMADTRVLSRLADGVVLVLRANRSTAQDALEAEAQIFEDGANLMGTVLNDAPARMLPYYSLQKAYFAATTKAAR